MATMLYRDDLKNGFHCIARQSSSLLNRNVGVFGSITNAHLVRRIRETRRQSDARGVIDGFEQTLRRKDEKHLAVPQSCVGFGALS